MTEGEQQFYDSLPDEQKEEVRVKAEEEFNRRMAEKMKEYDINAAEVSQFPRNEMEQIGNESFRDTLNEFKAEMPAEAPEAPSKPAEPKVRTPAPETAEQEEPAPKAPQLTVKDTKPRVKKAATLAELDAIEAEWEENGKPESTTIPKQIGIRREQLELEVAAEATDEELLVESIKYDKAIGGLAEDSRVRWTTPEGQVIEGQVRHDLGRDEQIGIEGRNQINYVDADEVVGVLTEYDTEKKPEPKPKPKKVKQEKYDDMTIDEWSSDYELELGSRPSAKELHDYMTGQVTMRKRAGAEPTPVGGNLDISLAEVKEALKARTKVEPEVIEEVAEEELVEEAPTEEELDVLEKKYAKEAKKRKAAEKKEDAAHEEEMKKILDRVSKTVAGVKINVNEKSFAPNARDMKAAIRAATTEEQLDEINIIENDAIESGSTKFRPSILTALDKRREEFKAAEEVASTLVDTSKEEEPEKPKVVAKPKKKPGQSPEDKGKKKDEEPGPGKKAKPRKGDARQAPPTEVRIDSKGRSKMADLTKIVKTATSVEVVEAAEAVYDADIVHRGRKNVAAFENLVERKYEELETGKKPVPKKKAKPKKKETEEESFAKTEDAMNAEWPWPRKDETIEESYEYLEKLEGDALADDVYEEITLRWQLTNGVNDHIDPHFVNQVFAEMEEFNPGVSDVREVVYDRLKENELIDEERNLRRFLLDEYPGATTLKNATGTPKSAKGARVGTPQAIFSDWLEVGEEEAADLKREFKKGEEVGKPKPMTIEGKDVEKKAEENKRDAEIAKLKAEQEADKADEAEEDVEKLKEELEQMAEDGTLPLQETTAYPTFSQGQAREYKLPTTETVKKIFKDSNWDVTEMGEGDPDVPEGLGWFVIHKTEGTRLDIVLESQESILNSQLNDPGYLAQLEKKYGKEGKDAVIVAAVANHTSVANIEGWWGKGRKTGIVGYYSSDAISGTHVIVLDNIMADEETLWHEAWHFALRNFLSDDELNTVFKVFPTEEHSAHFMELLFTDRDAAIAEAEKLGKPQEISANRIVAIFDKITDLAKRIAEALNFKMTSPTHAKAVIDLAKIADRVMSGDVWGEQQRQYKASPVLRGLKLAPDGTVVRSYDKVSGAILSEIQDTTDARTAEENREAETTNIPEDVADDPSPIKQDDGTRPKLIDIKPAEQAKYSKAGRRRSWLKQNLNPNRGVPARLRQLAIQATRASDAGTYRGHAAHDRLKKIIKNLRVKHGEDRVSQSLAMVLDGRMPMSQFARIYKLDPTGKDLESLYILLSDQAEIQTLLANQPNLPEDVRKQILANQFYQTRFYAIHVLGDGYSVPEDKFMNAVDAMFEAHQIEIDRHLLKAQKAIGVRDPFNLPAYMDAGHAERKAMVADLSKTRRAMIERAARALDPWYAAIQNLEIVDGGLVATWNEQTLMALASETVSGYLDAAMITGKRVPGPAGGLPVTNMMHRTLDKVFRDLYGEIQTPAERMARTIEVQSNLLASSVLYQKIFEEGEGQWWSGARQGDYTHRLTADGKKPQPGDYKKYGNMAGKFVTKETYDLLHLSGTFERELAEGLGKWFQWVQAWTRGTRLLWTKTIGRNFATSVTGFALRSGDALRSGWSGHMKDGVKLAIRIMKATYSGEDPEAISILADLVEKDIFDVTQESMMQAVQENLKAIGGKEKGATSELSRALQMYGLIDLPAKYASYMSSRDADMSHEEAVEHLHKFYQYRDSVPEIVSKINRYGFGDYFGYTWDSTRIWKNNLIYVAEQATRGDIRPLLGLTLALTVPGFGGGMGSLFLRLAPVSATALQAAGGLPGYLIGNALGALGLTDDDDDDLYRMATDAEMSALRNSVPSYDRDMPIAMWATRDSVDDPWTIHWNVLGNLSAFPLEDVILGAWQSSAANPDRSFTMALLHNLGQAGPQGIGMTWENLTTLISGRESIFDAGYKRPGLIDVASSASAAAGKDTKARSDWPEILLERGGQYFGESFAPGQSYNMFHQAIEVKWGRDPMVGRMLETREWKDVRDVFSRMVRKYDLKKDTQLKALGRMIEQDLESYKIEKYNAGTAGRADMKWKQGGDFFELLKSDRGRDGWHHALKTIERRVDDFRTLTKGNFTDAEIATYLKDKGIRKDEINYIVNGNVSDMTIDDFSIAHQPMSTQRGDPEIIEFFEKDKTIPVRYRALYDSLKDQGFVVGEYKIFKARAKRIRKEWRTSGK